MAMVGPDAATDRIQEAMAHLEDQFGEEADDGSREISDSSYLHADAFACPHCQTYAPQSWADSVTYTRAEGEDELSDITVSTCDSCGGTLLWRLADGNVIHPDLTDAPRPAADMPTDVRENFMEARRIVDESPRAAVALLRLAVDQLVEDLGADGGSRQVRVHHLTENGLHRDVLDALRSVRVVGPDAVHPGVIDADDDRETAHALFELLNIMVEQTITHEKQIGEIRDRISALQRTRDQEEENRTDAADDRDDGFDHR